MVAGIGASYDVLAIVDAMEAQGVDAGVISAVGDAIGHLGTSTLDVLKTCGVPALKVVAVKRTLAPQPADARQVRSWCRCATLVSRTLSSFSLPMCVFVPSTSSVSVMG